MVAVPIGWSIQGLAPAIIGGLMVAHQLRVNRDPAPGNSVKA
jgi:hypothetical protein